MGLRVQSTVGCFPEFCFLQFSVANVLVELRKLLINNFVFPTWALAAGFNNNKNNNSTFLGCHYVLLLLLLLLLKKVGNARPGEGD